ncbi:Crp/Fnr family transcriptional regulator [Photobacterium angustum]|uniref:Crp/Fnr family transcriptional regulator n=2 Tax=Photobacterium angustum TaxID=661 RepID=A0A2S7VI20_PHOAN|nr:Crp/Fnr family transcriptional regulator [Photobacterium angustum]KJF81580.1 Crp/Fnr family transcriptional regulator [Photobacterium damselae subsp. damselae]EAS63498.1 cyclic nucleotide binding protein, putative [Vibrio angustum S14] [Photobacterium angustum S14]KJF93712.1 Crp/Fnr family transcriptional regulator [Photobacterium angustum]KJG02083.1 Crp/Fnr family transcriptional regulator [Photobacterium angustum]KJG16848.1 Crp/Fnr family transcriptional regulator [Photobacterium angustum
MQLQTLGKGRFEEKWSQDKQLIEQTILNCISARRIFDENEKLLTQGEIVENLYLVDSGRVSMGVTARNGKTFLLGTLECEQQIFGEMEFFTGYRCQMNIIAVEPIEVAIIDTQKLQRCLLEQPRLSLYFASAIAIDYQDTIEILSRRLLYPITYNVAYDIYHQYLNDLPVDGFQKNYLEAERFATSDRVYRRAIKELESKGLIAKEKNGLRILNLEGLKVFIEE